MISDPLEKIGLKIKLAREELGCSIEELANHSRVSSHHIKNIELANRAELPEDTYLSGFLLKIFKTLKFEQPETLVEFYKEQEGSYVVQSIVNQSPADNLKNGKPFLDTSKIKIQPVYVILAVFLLFMSFFIFGSKSEEGSNIVAQEDFEKIIEKQEVEKAPEPTKPKKIQLSKEKNINQSGSLYKAGSGSQELKIKIKEVAWFQVIGVGARTVLYEGDVFPNKKPSRFVFKDSDGFVLATGNAGALQVTAGGNSFRLGKSGDLAKWYYPKEAKAKFAKLKKQ